MKNSVSMIGRVALVSGLAIGAFALAAIADWSAPLAAPGSCPTGNAGCDAPLNVGSAVQTKNGNLIVNGTLGVVGGIAVAGGTTGTPAIGQVLVANNVNGTAVWSDAVESGSIVIPGGAGVTYQAYNPATGGCPNSTGGAYAATVVFKTPFSANPAVSFASNLIGVIAAVCNVQPGYFQVVFYSTTGVNPLSFPGDVTLRWIASNPNNTCPTHVRTNGLDTYTCS